MKTIGLSEFVKRHTKDDFVGTKLDIHQLTTIQNEALRKFNNNEFIKGYADFCKIVMIKNEYDLYCPIAKITKKNKHLLVSEYKARSKTEIPVLVRYFPKGTEKQTKANYIAVILYSNAQLIKEGNDYSGSDYDIISINAEMINKPTHISPNTIIRNHLGSTFGGSGEKIDIVGYNKSVEFWNEHAFIE